MEQVPRADGPPAGERPVEQANRERPDGRLVPTGEAGGARPVPFAVPERLLVVDSTNRYLVSLVATGMPDGSEVPEGYAVVADFQSEGRGRLGRRWEAPPGTAVLCSILLKPDLGPEQLHLAAWAVALAAVRACRAAAGVELSLKWPNDLIAGHAETEAKVAGILSETLPPRGGQGTGGRVAGSPTGIVVGIGLNVNWPRGWPPGDWPPGDWPPVDSKDSELAFVAAGATALNRIAGRRIDRDELVGELLRNIGTWNAMLAGQEGLRTVAAEYRVGCGTIGREVRVELVDETVTGKALDVDDAGSLLVSTGTGVRSIHVGDVVHVR